MSTFQSIEEVLKAYPTLTRDGMISSAPVPITEETDGEEIAACRQWIRDRLRPRTTINIIHSSYGLKHRVEADLRGWYVSNGAFIVAMLLEGYGMKAAVNSPNAHFNFAFLKDAAK